MQEQKISSDKDFDHKRYIPISVEDFNSIIGKQFTLLNSRPETNFIYKIKFPEGISVDCDKFNAETYNEKPSKIAARLAKIKELGGIAQINENYLLTDENYNSIKVSYKHISYQKEILEWISKIKLEIANLIDLSVIISQYEKLVKNLTNQGEKMENKEIFSLIQENHSICIDIVENFEQASRDIINDFIKNHLYPKIEAKIQGSDFLLEEFNEYYEDYGCIIKIKHKKYTQGHFLYFVLQTHSHFSMLEWGLINSKNKLNRSESKLTELIEIILNSGKYEKIKAIKGAEGEWACAKKIDDFSNNLVLKLIEYKNNNEFDKKAEWLADYLCEHLFELKDEILEFNKKLKKHN